MHAKTNDGQKLAWIALDRQNKFREQAKPRDTWLIVSSFLYNPGTSVIYKLDCRLFSTASLRILMTPAGSSAPKTAEPATITLAPASAA